MLLGGLALGVTSSIGLSSPALARSSKWRDLDRVLSGRLVRPGDRSYAALATPRNLRYAALMPQGVAVCRDADDVAAAIAWARRTGTPFAIRGGGHNYMDASSSRGLLISTRRMTNASMQGAVLRAQAGIRNSDLARILPQGGAGTLLLPGGTCPNVGVVGLTLGGGIGPNAPWAGLATDHLREVTMVTANGDTVTASERQNADLFWALRGSAGGNYGVVTDLVYDLVEIPVTRATTFLLDFPASVATQSGMSWQQARRGHEEQIGGTWATVATPSGSRARVRAQVLLPEAEARDLMAPLLSIPATSQEIVERTWWETYAWYRTPVSPSNTFWDRSIYADRDLDSDVIDRIAGVVAGFPVTEGGFGSFTIMGWVGGKVGSVAPDATAYVHRSATSIVEMSTGWPNAVEPTTWPTPAPPQIRDWMTGLWDTTLPSTTGRSYQNFPDPALTKPLEAYYGTNLARLMRVKRTWDPDDVFTYSQGIPLRA